MSLCKPLQCVYILTQIWSIVFCRSNLPTPPVITLLKPSNPLNSFWVAYDICQERNTNPITRLMGPTWGQSGADRTQMGPMLAPWTSLSGYIYTTIAYVDQLNWWPFVCKGVMISSCLCSRLQSFNGAALLTYPHIVSNNYLVHQLANNEWYVQKMYIWYYIISLKFFHMKTFQNPNTIQIYISYLTCKVSIAF